MTRVTKENAEQIVSAARRVSEGEVPLGNLIKKLKTQGKELSKESLYHLQARYEISAALRELANVFGYFQMTKDENLEDYVVDCRTIHDLADEIEKL
jgi:hypothetical protein